jgi:hypothetical protein
VLALVIACAGEGSEHLSLAKGVAQVCNSWEPPVHISVDSIGRYTLNGRSVTGEELSRSLGVVVPPRSSKVVMVDIDSAYRLDLTWLLAEIRALGGIAYEHDTTCLTGKQTTPFRP